MIIQEKDFNVDRNDHSLMLNTVRAVSSRCGFWNNGQWKWINLFKKCQYHKRDKALD